MFAPYGVDTSDVGCWLVPSAVVSAPVVSASVKTASVTASVFKSDALSEVSALVVVSPVLSDGSSGVSFPVVASDALSELLVLPVSSLAPPSEAVSPVLESAVVSGDDSSGCVSVGLSGVTPSVASFTTVVVSSLGGNVPCDVVGASVTEVASVSAAPDVVVSDGGGGGKVAGGGGGGRGLGGRFQCPGGMLPKIFFNMPGGCK